MLLGSRAQGEFGGRLIRNCGGRADSDLRDGTGLLGNGEVMEASWELANGALEVNSLTFSRTFETGSELLLIAERPV